MQEVPIYSAVKVNGKKLYEYARNNIEVELPKREVQIKELELLDKKKNEIESAPVVSELAKLETLVKNDKVEEKYKKWFNTFESIKDNDIPKINDMIIDLDAYLDRKEYKDFNIQLAKAELAIYKAKTATDYLLDEIKEVNLSEEKYRKIITKLKTRYRELNDIFESKKNEYEQISTPIELQFENIEKRFQDFEYYMDQNDYQEVYHIVKGIDIMIDHMGIVIEEVPDLVLLANRIIPKRIEQITETYSDLKAKKFPLKHLKIEYYCYLNTGRANLDFFGHDGIEFFEADFSISVSISSNNHFIEFIIAHIFVQFLADSFKVSDINFIRVVVS